jgi:molybdopterin synthase sulfur carrier subunit
VKVDLRYFASLREALGCDGEHLELPASVDTAGALRDHLRDRGEPWTEAFAEHRTLRVAIDQAMASADTRLHDGAEVAFFPPVTGG